MTITRNFKLCLNAGTQNAPYINANQYDEGEEWVFDLYTEGGQKFTPSTGAIIGIKADGNAILNSGTVNSDGQVVITETQQMTAASGLAVFELLIEGETHGTANFIVNVERRPSDGAEFSDSDLSLIQEAVDSAAVIVEVIGDGDPSEVIGEHVDDWLDNHPEATTTVEDGAITAPKINNSLWDKILVNEEASGAVASFEDGADDVPVSSLKVALEPIQPGSGDPSPSNIRPITGHTSVTVERCGRNLAELKTLGAINLNTGELQTATTSSYARTDIIGCKPNTQYAISAGFQMIQAIVGYYNGSGYITYQVINAGSGATSLSFTTNENATKMVVIVGRSGETNTLSDFPSVMVEEGTTASDYEAYIGTSYPYTLGQNVYGGTVDLATGVLTVTHGIVDLGSLTWAKLTGTKTYFRSANELSDIKPSTGGSGLQGLMCSHYKEELWTHTVDWQGYDKSICEGWAGKKYIAVYDSTYANSSADDFKTAVSGVQLVYELATPTTVQLTPQEVKTLLGYNNISSTGTVDVIYHADTKLYVDKMTNVDNAIIAPTEKDFVATQNYTTGDLVIVNDTLYKVTANIATGSAITPNSNVQQTTLSALIKALS